MFKSDLKQFFCIDSESEFCIVLLAGVGIVLSHSDFLCFVCLLFVGTIHSGSSLKKKIFLYSLILKSFYCHEAFLRPWNSTHCCLAVSPDLSRYDPVVTSETEIAAQVFMGNKTDLAAQVLMGNKTEPAAQVLCKTEPAAQVFMRNKAVPENKWKHENGSCRRTGSQHALGPGFCLLCFVSLFGSYHACKCLKAVLSHRS